MTDIVDNKVFNIVEGGDSIDLFDRDLSRPMSEQEIFSTGTKFTSGELSDEGMSNIHTALDVAGVVNPGADLVNALLWAAEGKFGMAAINVAGTVPFIGDFAKHMMKGRKALETGEETVKLYRGVKGIDNPETLIKGENIIGNWHNTSKTWNETFGKKSHIISPKAGHKIIDHIGSRTGSKIVTQIPENIGIKNLLFTTPNKEIAERYIAGAGKDSGGMLLEFSVPISFINKHARDATGRLLSDPIALKSSPTFKGTWASEGLDFIMDKTYPSLIFTEGLPIPMLKNVYTSSGFSTKGMMTPVK